MRVLQIIKMHVQLVRLRFSNKHTAHTAPCWSDFVVGYSSFADSMLISEISNIFCVFGSSLFGQTLLVSQDFTIIRFHKGKEKKRYCVHTYRRFLNNERPRAAQSPSSRVEWKGGNILHKDRLSLWSREDTKSSVPDGEKYYSTEKTFSKHKKRCVQICVGRCILGRSRR